MKTLIGMMCLLATSALAYTELEEKIGRVSEARGKAYLAARDEVVALGPKVLPELHRMATANSIGWKTQLMARVVYERIARKPDIDKVQTHDWKAYPPYAKPGKNILRFGPNEKGEEVLLEVVGPPPGHVVIPMTGQSSLMGKHVLPVLREAGLWYYYIEQVWKQTNEGPPAMAFDNLFMESWTDWCAAVVKEQPEKIWWARALADRLEASDFKDWRDIALFNELLSSGESDAAPFLVRRFDDWFRADTHNREAFPGSWKSTYPRRFSKIMAFADASQSSLVEDFLNREPLLTPLRESVGEVRSRKSIDETERLRFRLGSSFVEIPPNP